MRQPRHPLLYELNARATLGDLSRKLGRQGTFDDVSSAEIDRLAALGFDWLWLMGVWQTGDAGRRISRTLPQFRNRYAESLPDFTASDICGSPYAVASYTAACEFGGNDGLARLCQRIRERGVRLMLDFVPNHTAIDHPWVRSHPEFYVRGTQEKLAREPENYMEIDGLGIFAHGRDPYFPGWADTLQLNYGNPALQEAMRGQLFEIAAQCDGVRCDMAMLLTPEIFQKTWGIEMQPFWPETIEAVREAHPSFTFMAEVYWNLEWNLQQQGFDYTYDKRLYDRLRSGDASAVRAHLTAGLDFQNRSVRFLENHDEPRAAAVFDPSSHRAAAMIAYFTSGMRFFHDGQLEGRRIRASVHLCRRPEEPSDTALVQFYADLLAQLRSPVFGFGDWQLLDVPLPVLAFSWRYEQEQKAVLVNFSPEQARFALKIPLNSPGLPDELDLAAWEYRVLDLTAA